MSQPLTSKELQELRDGLRWRTEPLLLDTWRANIIADIIDELATLRAGEPRTSTQENTEERDRLRGLVDDAVDMVESFKWYARQHSEYWGDEDEREIREWLEGARA